MDDRSKAASRTVTSRPILTVSVSSRRRRAPATSVQVCCEIDFKPVRMTHIASFTAACSTSPYSEHERPDMWNPRSTIVAAAVVGRGDGKPVGNGLGEIVGGLVGADVGAGVGGEVVGTGVGCGVGVCDGEGVGTGVGVVVGLGVGLDVGSDVGIGVGKKVGTGVGAGTGAGVGGVDGAGLGGVVGVSVGAGVGENVSTETESTDAADIARRRRPSCSEFERRRWPSCVANVTIALVKLPVVTDLLSTSATCACAEMP